MKITIQRAALLKPLQMINSVVERRQTLPILSNVLLRVEGQELFLTGTDLEIEMKGKAPLSEVTESGVTTVSARKLLDISRALPDDAEMQLMLDDSKNHLIVRSGKSRFLLATLPASDFPSVEESAYTAEFSITQGKFKKLLSKTQFAMGQQDVRHYLNGTLFDLNQGMVKCVATDGHRLAYSSLRDETLDGAQFKIILPRKSVLELIRLLDSDETEKVTVRVGEHHFRVNSSQFTFISKLINAQYPDYEKLIPKSVAHTAIASRDMLRQALTRASILSNEKFRGIRMQLDTDLMRIMANNPEQEEAEELVPLKYQGNGLELGFNVAYILDVVSTVTTDNIRWSFNNPESGILIEAHEESDGEEGAAGRSDDCYIVMPMKL